MSNEKIILTGNISALTRHGNRTPHFSAMPEKQESFEDRLLKISEAANYLRVTVNSLYHMVSQGRVPCIRLSKRCLRFRVADLKQLVSEKYVPAR
jgi:excisionase family DNA binding protein